MFVTDRLESDNIIKRILRKIDNCFIVIYIPFIYSKASFVQTRQKKEKKNSPKQSRFVFPVPTTIDSSFGLNKPLANSLDVKMLGEQREKEHITHGVSTTALREEIITFVPKLAV